MTRRHRLPRPAQVTLIAGALFWIADSILAQPVYLPPISVRITGYVGAAPEGVRPEFTWRVSRGDKESELLLIDLLDLKGNLSAPDISAIVEPYQSRFQLAGTEAAMGQLEAIPPRQLMLIFAYLRLYGGANYLVLDRIEPVEPPTPKEVDRS